MVLEHAIQEADRSLDKIVCDAEDFVREDILGGGIFGVGGWDDVCGQKIGEAVIDCVEHAVSENLYLYDSKEKLQRIADNVQGIASVIEAVKKELQ